MSETPATGISMTGAPTLPVIAAGYDGSAPAAAALEWAALEAKRTGAVLRVISVVHHPGLLTGTQETTPMLPAKLLNRVHDLVAEGASRARKILDSERVETQIVIGAAAAALVCATHSVRLLVVGNRGRSEVVSTVLGSVSFAVTAHAHCPVVVVAEGAVLLGPQHGVVVGVDGSKAGTVALDLAADVAAHAGAALRVICAWDLPAADSWAYAYWETASPDTDWARTQHDAAARVVATAAERSSSRHRGLVVAGEALQGQAGDVLGSASRNAGLVVVGSRGLGGFSGLVLGSVSHHVIHSCACPVMVVRTPPADRPATSEHGDVMRDDLTHDDVMAGSRPVPWWDQEPEGRPDDNPHIPPRRS